MARIPSSLPWPTDQTSPKRGESVHRRKRRAVRVEKWHRSLRCALQPELTDIDAIPTSENLLQTARIMMPAGLTARQQAFALAYPYLTFSAAKAAVLAGYSPPHARQSGHQVRHSPVAGPAIDQVSIVFRIGLRRHHMGIPEFHRRYGPAIRQAIRELIAADGRGRARTGIDIC